MDTTMDRGVLESKLLPELQQIAQTMGVEGAQKLRKAGLIDAIVAASDGQVSYRGQRQRRQSRRAPRRRAEPTRRPRRRIGRAAARVTAVEDGPSAIARTSADRRERRPRRSRRRRPGPRRPVRARRWSARRRARRQASPTLARGAAPDARRATRPRGSRIGSRRSRPRPTRSGILDILPDNYGFLRTSGYLPGPEDVYVSLGMVRKYNLRKGDTLEGQGASSRGTTRSTGRCSRWRRSTACRPEQAAQRPVFDKLTPLFPDERFLLESGAAAVSERIIDMIAPIGKGQRGMIVAPPKSGKTTILKQIANGIIQSSPETHVIVLLVDERPEEVTDWQRTVQAAEVIYSTFDKPTDQHIQVTELVLERAKRLAEMGQDVAIILDSLTRLTRAYNLAMPASGKILTGGIDSAALYPPRRFFGAARNIEEGGSVTIIASALVETGSRMDDGIFEEFKATGNMELRLDRSLSEKRLFPAINVDASSTRKEELLLQPEELALVIRLRRVLHALEPGAALELLIDKLRATKSNEQFLKDIAKAPTGG